MEAQEVVTTYFEALSKGEIAVAMSYFTADAKWSQPGENKFSGQKNGKDEIFKMIGGMMDDTSASVKVRPNGTIMKSANLVAVPVWFTAQKETKKMDMGGLDLFEVKEGKIVQVWTFSDDQNGEDEFWGK